MKSLRGSDTFINTLKGLSLVSSRIRVCKDKRLIKKQKLQGDFFVSLPENLAVVLPGSIILPKLFLTTLGVTSATGYWSKRLNGNHFGNKTNPAFTHKKDRFLLRVFHGSVNRHALNLTRIAAKNNGFTEEKVRAEYQKKQYLLIRPVLDSESDYHFRMIEDCVASGDTILGGLTLLALQGKVSKRGKIRIDVVVATTQGILVIKEYALQNNLDLEINTGYLAYGLSEGSKIPQSSARVHANYLVYPEAYLSFLSDKMAADLKSLRNADGNIYVVGDMGDAAQKLTQKWNSACPWNRLRTDQHGLAN